MENKKIERDNYNIHIIKTNRFKAINVDVYFTKKANKKDYAYSNLLYKIMLSGTKKYNSLSKLNKKLESIYGAILNSTHRIEGNLDIIGCGIEFIHPKYTENSMYLESLKMLKEFIFNPNIINEKDDSNFFVVKKNIISNIISSNENPNYYSSLEYKKIMYKGTIQSSNILGSEEEYNDISPSSLYSFYKKLFSEYMINIVVTGDVENDNIFIDYFDKMFSDIKTKREKINMYSNVSVNKMQKIIETRDYNQSHLIMGYKCLDLTENEKKYVLDVYNMILGVINNSILFTSLREKNSMCYSVGSSVNKYYPSITVTSAIDKNNYNEAIKIIKQCVKDMSNKKILSSLYSSAIKTINTILNGFYDSYYSISNHYLLKEFLPIEDVEIRKEKLNNVTIDEIISLNKKLKLSVIYFLKGEKE